MPSRLRQTLKEALRRAVPRRLFLVSGPAAGAAVCLTFDDGPHPEHTPRLLDVLRDHGARATFFVIGEKAEAHPGIVRRIAAEGHAVGHHSFHHRRPEETSAPELAAEVARTLEVLRGILGREPSLFRPPYGKVTAGKLLRLWSARQTVMLWNVDPRDFAAASAGEVAAWFAGRSLHAGDVVLLHDTFPHAAAVLPALIAEARTRGLRFETPAAWLG
jgi:peptidoglycan-N-acetylglucosamine deacetylase